MGPSLSFTSSYEWALIANTVQLWPTGLSRSSNPQQTVVAMQLTDLFQYHPHAYNPFLCVDPCLAPSPGP